MPISDLEYLRHIYDETTYLLNVSQDLDEDSFSRDETIKRAFARSIEIIGEASKKISDEFKRRHSGIDWRSMARMRDKLIHAYFGIDLLLLQTSEGPSECEKSSPARFPGDTAETSREKRQRHDR